MFDVDLLVFQARPCSFYFYGAIQTDCQHRSRADSKPSIASWRGCICHIHVQLRVVCLPEWQGRAGQFLPTAQCHEATCHPQRPVPDTAASYRGDVLNGFPSAAYMSDCCSAASTRAVQVL
jgi:hypothetical protein